MSAGAYFDLAAPAKLNLLLHVIGRRPDGYHLLQSLIVLIDWCDTLHVERRSDGRLARHDLASALPEDDLCLRAARALQQASGTTSGADIWIEKGVPSGAGMGGGSSDAATTLLALNRLWRLGWPRTRLGELALSLGADVPFFIGGQNALVEGIGERLTPVPVVPQWFAVLKPEASIDTGSIFVSSALCRETPAVILPGSLEDAVAWSETAGRNDLQPPAESLCPDVTRALDCMRERFGNSRMTGSGSAVFSRAGTGDRPMASLPEAMPAGWVGRMCRSLAAHPLADWAAG